MQHTDPSTDPSTRHTAQIAMNFALSKTWLPVGLQRDIWLWAHDTPSARVMRDVKVTSRPLQRGLPMKQLKLTAGVRHRSALGRSCVNPCYQCELAENTGVSEFCGHCRSRPIVYATFLRDPYLGLSVRICGDLTPRTTYLRRHNRNEDDSD